MKPTDVAGGVTDEELDELIDELIEIRRLRLGGIRDHIEVSRARLRRFANEQQARGVELSADLVSRAIEQYERYYGERPDPRDLKKDLRALAERLRKGQL